MDQSHDPHMTCAPPPQWGHLTFRWGSMTWPSQQDLTSFDTGLGVGQGEGGGAALTRLPSSAGLPPDLLKYIGGRSGELGPTTHPTVVRVFEERRRRLEEGSRLDWATAESLAVGSLLLQG